MQNSQKLLHFVWQNYCKPKKIPLFEFPTSKVGTINSAMEFYSVLIKGIRESRFRINLSSLYIGTGPMEQFMLEEILKASNRNKYLKVNIILDRFRGQRVSKPSGYSSFRMLSEIFNRASNPHNLNFSFCQHNNLSRIWDDLNAVGFNEVFGTFHSKQYIFDNTVILSGANLSEDYFTYRTDRYVYLNNVKEFADYLDDFNQIFADLGDKVVGTEEYIKIRCRKVKELKEKMDHRFRLFLYNSAMDSKTEFLTEENINSFLAQKQNLSSFAFLESQDKNLASINKLRDEIVREIKESKTAREVANNIQDPMDSYDHKYRRYNEVAQPEKSELSKIFLVPSFQVPLINYAGEQELFVKLLEFLISSDPSTNYELSFTTGYFNPTDALLTLFQRLPKHVKVDIIAAAPHANSFFKGKGFKGRVPGIYRVALHKWVTSLASLPNISFYEYSKEKSTYHSKGIWLLSKSKDSIEYLTIYGSSNYAKRSYLKDLEAQFLIFARSPEEIKMFEEERADILKDCHRLTSEIIENDQTTRVSFTNRLIYRLLRNFI